MLGLLTGHMIGDYLFQNRWMAAKKRMDWRVCLLHAVIYAAAVCLCAWWLDWRFFVVLVSHFVIDKFAAGMKWRMFFSRDNDLPWTITSDNAMHLLVLLILSLL